MQWMPTLNREEIALVEKYYHEHKQELDDEDRRIRAYVAEQIRLQRLRFPEESSEIRLARMKDRLHQRQFRFQTRMALPQTQNSRYWAR